MEWVEIRVRNPARREAVIDAFFAAGALAVQEEADAVVTHFPERLGPAAVAAVRLIDPLARIETRSSPQASPDMLHGTVRPVTVGALTVAPPWLAGHDEDRTILVEPAMGFGTGEHPTTRGVLRLMQTIDMQGLKVADVGAGSAVLAIAAAKLGASRATALELDPDAVPNAVGNVARNNAQDTVQVIQGDGAVLLPLLAPLDLVLANIVSSVLAGLLPVIASSLAPGGRAILSGLLIGEQQEFLAELARARWTVEAEDREDEWWSVLITRS